MTESFSTDRRTLLKLAVLGAAGTSVVGPARSTFAAAPRALDPGSLPADVRLGTLKDLDGYFPWQPSKNLVDWKKRSDQLRRQMLVANGLWPMPTKRPLDAVVDGKVDRDDYSVECVILQTGDGLYCTGNLYRPKRPANGKLPVILSPHGHSENGRFHQHSDEKFANELKTHAETLPSGRFPLQARCVQLARMGCLVFQYDMLGYADSAPISYQLAHLFRKQREELSSPERWGLFSAQSELRCLSVAGLQTWNSIRALDWLISMDDVDPDRIGVTGESGGATQTLLLGAVDQRPTAFFPAVMVSTAMQGGCPCENASYLRVNTGNVEIAALLAPRPLGMAAADDWTRELETKGLPELRQHYAIHGMPENVSGKYFAFPHNFNQPSRLMMYEFFNTHLNLKQQSPIVERDFEPLSREEMTVWTESRPAPAATVENELQILRGFTADQERQFKDLIPTDSDTHKAYRDTIGGAWEAMIGRALPGKDDFQRINKAQIESDGLLMFQTLIRLKKQGEEIPTLFYLPRKWNNHVAIWITDDGKSSLMGEEGNPRGEVQKLLQAGVAVAMPDLLYQGEFLLDNKPLAESRKVPNAREVLAFTTGYNHPLFAQRVHDVLTMIAFCRYGNPGVVGVHVIGLGRMAGPITAAAAFRAGDAVNKVAIGTAGFRFASLTNIYDPMLLPGAVRYGDVPGLLGLVAPHPLWLAGEGNDAASVTTKCYETSKDGRLTSFAGMASEEAAEAVNWLLTGLR